MSSVSHCFRLVFVKSDHGNIYSKKGVRQPAQCQTKDNELYLSSLVRYIATPLSSLLERENSRPSQKIVRTIIQETLLASGADDPFATLESSNAVAKQIASSLRSNVCTIWLRDPSDELTLQGIFCSPLQEISDKLPKVIRDVFSVNLIGIIPLLKAKKNSIAWQALTKPELQNYGPNRDPTFLQQDYAQPFMIMPLLPYDNHAIGLIHVGLKSTTPDNSHGFYSRVDEQLLESFQREVIALYEQRRFRAMTELATQDLHDALSLVTFDLLYGIDHARHELELDDSFSAAAVLQDIEHTADSLTGELRGIMIGLKSHVLENVGLVKALQHFIKANVERSGLKVDFASDEPSTWLPIKLSWQLYRIAQEALTNVIKHARADHIVCRVDVKETEVTLYIRDNGQGFDVQKHATERHGMTNISKRAESLRGTLNIQSEPGEGTTVTVKVPRGVWHETTTD